ncbi:hypothetical protein AAG565_10445 [Fontimonas sp. SYSU GA230001]|uniref:hypothetical protein n=1 Tax=Fontimonas sp. SYSU GA230001 TaxID=3142450 RepID=UPI0032B5552E
MKAHTDFRNGRRAQRGAAAVFAAIALLAAITAVMFAIEIGRMYWAQTALQKQANLAALDAARVVGGCAVESIEGTPTQADIEALVQQTLLSNGVASDALAATQVDLGTTIVNSADETHPGPYRSLESTLAANAEAVRVTLRQPFPQPFLPILPSQQGRFLTASATAEQAAVGSFFVGSGLLALDGGIANALLSGLLGSSVSLTAADYNGLAGVRIPLGVLATAIGLDAHDLSDPLALSTQNPLLGSLLQGLADALTGTANGTVVSLLHSLATAAQSGSNNPVPLGLLFPTVDEHGADVASINLLDLLIAAGAAANADASGATTPIALPVAVSIPGVTTLQVFLRVLEPAQFSGMGRPGEAEARTAQIRLMLRMQVDALSTVTNALTLLLGGGLIGSVSVTPLNLGLDLDVAQAAAYLDRIRCPRSASPDLVTELSARAAVADLKLGTFSGNPLSAPALSNGAAQLLGVTVNLLGGLLAQIKVNLFLAGPAQTTVGSAAKQPLPRDVSSFQWIEHEPTPYWQADGVPPAASVADNPQTVGSTGLIGGTVSSLFNSLSITATDPDHPDAGSSICLLKVLGICTLSIPVGNILDAVLNPVVALLGTILSPTGALVDSLLDPLLKLLGVEIGSATVTMNTVAIDSVRIISMDLPPTP